MKRASWTVALLALAIGRAAGAETLHHPFDGFRLTLPAGWSSDPQARPRGAGLPLTLRNYSAALQPRPGVIPGPGNAQISVRMLPAETDEFTHRDRMSSCTHSARNARGSGEPARLDCADPPLHDVYVYPRKSGKLFFVDLTYRVEDRNGADYEQAMQRVIDSIRVDAASR